MSLIDRGRKFASSAFSLASEQLKTFSKLASPAAPGFEAPAVSNGFNQADSRTLKELNSWEALLGRISYAAGPNYTRYSSYPATKLQPQKVYEILRQADLGYPLLWAEACEQILERDAHIRSTDYARRVETSGKPVRVHAANETDLANSLAKFCKAVVDEIDAFDQAVEDLLGANGQGWSCSEIVWEWDAVRFPGPNGEDISLKVLCPRRLDWIHPKHFYFEQFTDEPQLVLGPGKGQVSLPPNKFIFHAAAGTGLIERRGFMRSCVWPHLIKMNATRDWAVFENMYGIPQVEGVYDPDRFNADANRTMYQQMLADFGKGTPALHPNDFEIKITNPPPTGKADDVFGALIGFANTEMSKAIQGETLTTELGGMGSYNAAAAHADVKHAIVRADARKLSDTMRRFLLTPIIDLNIEALAKTLGASPEDIRNNVPKISWRIDRETDPKTRAEIITMALKWGLKVDQDQQRDEFGLDAPKPGSEPLTGEPVILADGAKAVGTLEAAQGVDNPKDVPPTSGADNI